MTHVTHIPPTPTGVNESAVGARPRPPTGPPWRGPHRTPGAIQSPPLAPFIEVLGPSSTGALWTSWARVLQVSLVLKRARAGASLFLTASKRGPISLLRGRMSIPERKTSTWKSERASSRASSPTTERR